jgi:NAD(P)-dependent dehydrogenase (short-subunit alcohol dehydrogenase family)
MSSGQLPLAIVTGASTGISYELAKCCAREGFNLVVAADKPALQDAAEEFRHLGAAVDAVQADLSKTEGVNALLRPPRAAQLRRCWPMPGVGSGTASWTRTGSRPARW